jgi:hypothetical protein
VNGRNGQRELQLLLRVLRWYLLSEEFDVNRGELELLDKQLWGVSHDPPRSSIVIVLLVIAVFVAGVAVGDYLFVHAGKPAQTTSHVELNIAGLGDGS